MASPAITGSTWNPAEDKPSNVEDAIVTAMMQNPNSAYMSIPLLNDYTAQRHMANMNYADQVNQQRQYAYQVLQNQAQNAAAERAISAYKDVGSMPGGMGVLSSNPVTAPYVQSTDPSAVPTFSDFATRSGVAKTLEATGKGAQGMLAGGVQASPGYYSAILGPGSAVQPADPALVQAAKVRAASGEGRGGGGDKNVTTYINPDNPMEQTVVTGKGHMGANPYSSSPGGRTTLPMAKTDEGPVGTPASPNERAQVVQAINANKDRIGAKAYADIVPLSGTPPNVLKTPSGQLYVVGKSGTKYPFTSQ